MRKILGVTGRIGSGKSTVCNELAFKFGYSIIEVDVIRYALMKKDITPAAVEFRKKLAHAFDVELSGDHAWFDYDAFAKKLFSSKENVSKCADIMTPYIKAEIRAQLATTQGNVAIAWAYLIEHDYLELVDSVLLVTCSDSAFEQRQYLLVCSIDDAIQRRNLEPSDDQRICALKALNIPFTVYENNNYDFSALHA